MAEKEQTKESGDEHVYDVGRLCMKIAGRDAGVHCVVVDQVNEHTVLIDGQARRRPCNTRHLEALSQTLPLKKGASPADVEKEFKKLGLAVRKTKPKKKQQAGSSEKSPLPAETAAAPEQKAEKTAEKTKKAKAKKE